MNLVRAQVEIVAQAERCELRQLLLGVGAPGGILRVAQHEQARAGAARGAHGVEVHDPAFAVSDERHFNGFLARMTRRRQKGVVDGRGNQYGAPGFGHRACGQVEAGHDAGYPDQPLLGHFPAIAALEPAQERAHGGVGRARIPQHGMLQALGDGRADEFRHGEIHVRDPERKDVPPLVLVPLGARRVASIDDFVELALARFGRHAPSVNRSALRMVFRPACCCAA